MSARRKGKAPASAKTQGAFENQQQHADFIAPARFAGSDNPRHLRAINALLHRPLPRENLDTLVGCSNGPELVAELRRRGLELPCRRIDFVDRDGFICHPGVYHFTTADRRKVFQWQAKRQPGAGHA